MERNVEFLRFKAKHPNWSDEQIWAAISIDQKADEAIDAGGENVDLNNPDIWKQILEKAKEWLAALMPIIYEQVKEIFDGLLANLKQWVSKGLEYVFDVIKKWVFSKI